jgi:hypothetical protein
MDQDILKLLPQKAFKLISFRESLRIGALVSSSILDKKSYQKSLEERIKNWKVDDVTISTESRDCTQLPKSKEDGEKILKVYFAQFYGGGASVHLDLRAGSFCVKDSFLWIPSKLHYSFSPQFKSGVCTLYEGFYLSEESKFEAGLSLLGILKDTFSKEQKKEVVAIFYSHFGEGKDHPVHFSLKKLQDSFNTIFSYFLKEDIPLNPEFAVLGAMLVTLYTTLENIPHELSARDAFLAVAKNYQHLT